MLNRRRFIAGSAAALATTIFSFDLMSCNDFECPGSGIIDFPSLFREARSQGIKHYMVERDNVPDGTACLRSAAEYLKKVTF